MMAHVPSYQSVIHSFNPRGSFPILCHVARTQCAFMLVRESITCELGHVLLNSPTSGRGPHLSRQRMTSRFGAADDPSAKRQAPPAMRCINISLRWRREQGPSVEHCHFDSRLAAGGVGVLRGRLGGRGSGPGGGVKDSPVTWRK